MLRRELREFKKFILRGNVVDLAVGVAIGAAFNSIVQALVADLITPLIGLVGNTDGAFANRIFTFHGHELFKYGHFLNVLISFILTAGVIFFLVVQPVNRLTSLAAKRTKTEDPSTKKCPECLSEVPRDATRCKFCTTKLSISK